MNSTRNISTIVLAIYLFSGTSAFAQDHDRREGRQHGEHAQDGDRGHDRGRRDHDERRGNGRRGDDRRVYEDRRGAGPSHDFYRGSRLPVYYRSRQYVVDDWRAHRLSAPPRGYHWVQTGGDYVLVAVATGIILRVLLN